MATTYFDRFFEEKELPYRMWEIVKDDTVHFIDSEVVIEAIKNAPAGEQKAIRNTLVAIDFRNGDVMHYLEHLAKILVKMHS